MQYALLAVPFLLFAYLVFRRAGLSMSRRWLIALGILFALTLLFDSLIIYAEIVDYDYSKTLGIILLKAPVEDFAYTVAALLLTPALWILTKKGGDKK
jgi:small toxic polypeptide LdrA/B/C/D